MQETVKKPYRLSASLLNDAQLVDCLVRGDRNAQEEFVRRFEKLMWAILSRMELSRQEQEDLFQQVFVHLWEDDFRRLQMWDAGKGRLRSYLGVVTAHLAYDHLRRKAGLNQTAEISVCLNLPAQDSDLDAIVFQHVQAEAIQKALQELKPRDASLVRQRHFYGRSYREISAACGMTVGNVGVALARAERRLRQIVRQANPALFDFAQECD